MTISSVDADKLVTDYALPSAIMVAHYACDLLPMLEALASRISKYCGVILLSQDKTFTQKFIDRQNNPEHFSIVSAPYDSPWLRDRSPIATEYIHKGARAIRWCVPTLYPMGRAQDDALFAKICAGDARPSPIESFPHGNIIGARGGLALITRDLLKQNGLSNKQLGKIKTELGVKNWLIFTGFYKEMTGHADVHVRALGPNIFALAWNMSVREDRRRARVLETKILAHMPDAQIIKIPIRSKGKSYGSVLNWVQIGKNIIAPYFDITHDDDLEKIKQRLQVAGFTTEFMHSPTLKLGGSLHCLSASIYV